MLSHFSHVWLFVTPWIVACQAPLSMGFSSQKYWSGLPFPFPGELSHPGIEPISLMSPALTGGFFTTCPTWGANLYKTPQQKSATIWAWGAPNIHGSAKRVNRSFCSSSWHMLSKTRKHISGTQVVKSLALWINDDQWILAEVMTARPGLWKLPSMILHAFPPLVTILEAMC